MLAAMFLSAHLLATDNTKPWTFWYWMYGAVTKPAIQADLIGMKNVGLGGCYLMPIRSVSDRPEYQGNANQLSVGFWDHVDYAFQQADSLGLEMGIHICDGFALAGGPWIKPAESMQQVVWTDTIVSGNYQHLILKQPKNYQGFYQDIVTLAIPIKEMPFYINILPRQITCGGGVAQDEKGTYRASEDGYIDYDLGEEKTVRSLVIRPSGNNIQAHRLRVLVSADGKYYQEVKQLKPCRQGWQSTGYDYTYSIRPTTARYFRFEWTPKGTEPGSEDLDAGKWKPVLKLKNILLSGESKINQWEGKTAQTWRIAEETGEEEVEKDCCVPVKDIRILTLEGDKVVSKSPQENTERWRILRFGHTSTGQMNATAGGGKGLEIDKFNVKAVDKLFDNWYKQFLSRPYADVVKFLHVDSWECGVQNWGHDFAQEFERRRGYGLLPYMALYAGIPIESAAKSEKVMRDIRQTINDLVRDVFFKRLYTLAKAHGKQVSHESIAPTFVADGLEHYNYADVTMGEFWLQSPTHDKPNDMLDAISAAHTYGKQIVQAEGFTEVRGVWNETPAMIKPLLDRNWAMGMNKLFFHVTAHNPWMDRKPGMTLDGIGLFYQRDNTWYAESKGLIDYITRCQRMLQQGVPVVDIAVFSGEEMPSRSVLPERLLPILPGIFGRERLKSEAVRLANEGLPMEESPVGVLHSAGIIDTKNWVNPLRGYQYDSMNKDVLLNGSEIRQGQLVMPLGNSYKILVLPGKTAMDPSFKVYSEEVRKRIDELKKQGVIIIDKPYEDETFDRFGIMRDATLPSHIAYTHRRTAHKDIYFVANQENRKREFDARFRAHGHVSLYNPMTDKTTYIAHTSRDGQPIRLVLDAHQSVFVVFGPYKEGETKSDKIVERPLKHVFSAWTVAFPHIEKPILCDTLFDWSQSADDKIRYFSGTASYTATLQIKPKADSQVVLKLGKVCDIAHVYVNNIDCGTFWTAPYEVDITHAVRRGKNTLRIEVVNTWANAMRGADLGKAPFEGIWTNAKYRMKGDVLIPAGLIGPISITETK